uniref:Uncharacterized protein n=1 Tax=Anguilla anguilla TaxID=7936 RepID=A0A0E9V2B6_ANGAN
MEMPWNWGWQSALQPHCHCAFRTQSAGAQSQGDRKVCRCPMNYGAHCTHSDDRET